MRTLLFFLFIAISLVAPAQTWEHFRMAENPCQLVVSDSMIWIGGQDFGLVGMNPATAAREVTYRQDNSPILDDEIVALEAGPTGSLWIGHTRGLSIKRGDQWMGSSTLLNGGIESIAPVTSTQGWVETIAGKLWWFDGKEFRDSLRMSQAGNQSQVHGLRAGVDGEAWASTLDGLLFLGKDKIDTISWEGTPWSTNNSYPILLPDQQGGVWVSGFFRDTFAYYRPVTGWTTYPVGTWSSSVTLDKQDRLWLAQQYSLLHWTPTGIEETRRQIGTLYTNEDAFRIDEEGNIWTTTSDVQGGRGVAVRYGLDGTRTYFTADPHSLWSRGVNAMALDSSGALYVSPDFGGPLSRFHPDTREWDLIEYSSNMIPNSWDWSDIAVDSEGRILTVSNYNDIRHSEIDFDGVQAFNPETNEWTFLYGPYYLRFGKFSEGSGSPIALSGSPVSLVNAYTLSPLSMPSPFPIMEQMSALVWDQQDRLWAIQTGSRYTRHIWVYKDREWEELSFAQDSMVQWQSVLVDERDVKWLVAKSGVLVVDERFPKSLGRGETWLNRTDLGLMGDEEITAAQIGPQGYLWMATSWFRILRYDCEGTQVYPLSGNNLPIPSTPFLSMVVDQKGRIFLGTANDGMYLLTLDQAFPTTPACMLEAQPVSDNWIAYPNPATDNISFSHGNPAVGTIQIQWYDLSGKLIRQESLDYQHPRFISNVEGMVSGLYLVQITDGAHSWTMKVWIR